MEEEKSKRSDIPKKCRTCLYGRDFQCDYKYRECKDYTSIDYDIIDLQLNNFIEEGRKEFHNEWYEMMEEYYD